MLECDGAANTWSFIHSNQEGPVPLLPLHLEIAVKSMTVVIPIDSTIYYMHMAG